MARKPYTKKHVCGRIVQRGGACMACGYMPPAGRGKEEDKHLGVCHQCNGPMGCQRPVKHKGDRCGKHGGPTPSGAAIPKKSRPRDPDVSTSAPVAGSLDLARCLPGALSARYEAAMADPALLSIRSDVALLAVRQAELAGRLYGGEAGTLWKRLRSLAGGFNAAQEDMKQAREANDAPGMATASAAAQQAITSILRTIEEGNGYESAWRDLIDHSKEVASLKTQENARLRDLRQLMSVEESMALAGGLIQAVVEAVPDRRTRLAISAKFTSLLGENELWRKLGFRAAFGDACGLSGEAGEAGDGLQDGPPDERLGDASGVVPGGASGETIEGTSTAADADEPAPDQKEGDA